MLNKMTGNLDFHAKALVLRAQRQQLIASNIANADTPGYVARDVNFKEAMGNALAASSSQASRLSASSNSSSKSGHIALGTLSGSTLQLGSAGQLAYGVQSQPSMDNNSVDLDRERANFVDNTVRYEATLRFINADAKTMLAAIQGQ
jgi:flagellar basal-body rod protein FlgB